MLTNHRRPEQFSAVKGMSSDWQKNKLVNRVIVIRSVVLQLDSQISQLVTFINSLMVSLAHSVRSSTMAHHRPKIHIPSVIDEPSAGCCKQCDFSTSCDAEIESFAAGALEQSRPVGSHVMPVIGSVDADTKRRSC